MKFHVSFKVSIITVLIVMVLSMTLSIFTAVWFASSDVADEVADDLFKVTAHSARENVKNLLENAIVMASSGAVQSRILDIPTEGVQSKTLPFLLDTLTQNDAIYSVYYGFEDGSFFQVIAPRNSKNILDTHKAPEQTQWIVRSIFTDNQRIQRWVFLDKENTVIGGYDEEAPSYDPRKRPWYQASIDNNNANLTSPYLFNSLAQPGITASHRLMSGKGVFGVDLTLKKLSEKVTTHEVSENGGIFMYDRNDRLLALSPNLGVYHPLQNISNIQNPLVKLAIESQEIGTTNQFQKVGNATVSIFVKHQSEKFRTTDFNLVIVAPEDDFKSHFIKLQKRLLIIVGFGLLIFILISYLFASQLAATVIELSKRAERMKNMVFEDEKPIMTRIVEFNTLITSLMSLRQSLNSKSKELKIEQDKLKLLIELGIALSAEQDSDKLMEMVLLGAKDLTNADGGTLYTLEDDQKLTFQIVRNDTLNIKMGGTSGNEVNIPPVPIYTKDNEPNMSNVVSYCVHQEKSVNIEDSYHVLDFDFSGTRAFDESHDYHSQSFLTVPLKPRGGNVIGALQIINARKPGSDEIIPFDASTQPYIEALAAQAATALYNRELLDAQKRLLDALIQLIAGAIDAKSPYTGGHCERVPELAIMLAEEACKINVGHLAEFNFKNEDEWREFEIGAWLHDCGKVVTPEHIVDKATKLETIYNRIHEIRTRFEVLLRDAEIKHLKSLLQGIDPSLSEKTFEDEKQKLFDNFAFVAECNVGGEFMADDKITRLGEIAQTQWQRNFNIHLGLSYDEALRYKDEPIGPCTENLLADKAMHITPRDSFVNEFYEDRNFKVDIPKNLFNLGEVYNLSIKRGTLTDEDRFKINDHVIQTIVMLEQLPLPKHLKRIPEYAGTHHENMIGTGYPRKLDESELSIPARIMAIADVFEALTASDRPYKQPKSLNEAIKILSFFKKDHHIDPVLFDLFLTSGIYKVYAQKFLRPEQIDEVDITQYIG